MPRRRRLAFLSAHPGILLAALCIPLAGMAAGSLIASDTVAAMNRDFLATRGPVVALRQPAPRAADIRPIDLVGTHDIHLPADDPFWALASRPAPPASFDYGSADDDYAAVDTQYADAPAPPADPEPVRVIRAADLAPVEPPPVPAPPASEPPASAPVVADAAAVPATTTP